MTAFDAIQAERILRIETPLGPDVLLPERMELREAVGGLFEARVAVRSKNVELAPGDLIGKPVDVSLETAWGQRRTWNALVTELVEHPRLTRGLRSYRLVLRPEAWLMTQRSDARIWLDMTAVQVAETLLSEHGLPMPDVSGVVEPVEPHHYSVQWLETDWDYLVRRLEADGLWHWFRHEGGAPGAVAATHRLHLANHQAGWRPGAEAPDGGEVRYSLGSADRNRIERFVRTYAMRAGARAGRDWNFLTPSHTPEGATPTLHALPRNGPLELFDYPSMGGWGPEARASDGIDAGRVEARTKMRMQATEADHERVDGGGDIRSLAPGRRFTPYDVANPENVFEEHVATAVLHRVVDRSYETATDEPDYACTFEAVPARVPLTPHRATPRPRIDGQQIAVVAGPPGEEIHPDEHGRVKLWFPWDRRARKDGTDTCWVRVAQSWAGAGWGAQTIPRIGMEVLVSYLDGDPDRPIVTGAVPNTRQHVHYPLPEHKTKSVFRTNTHQSKDAGQFNELTFEDEAGRENVFTHAQRDRTTRVLHDTTARVDRHEVRSVGGSRALEVSANQKTEVGGSMSTVIGGTGASALAIMAGLAGMAGHTAGLLKQAGEVAGGEGAAPAMGAFAGAVASSALGFLSLGGLGARGRVVNGLSDAPDAGRALGDAGSGVGEAAQALFPLPGIKHSVIAAFRSDSIGVARSEQIGVSKVTNVGRSFVTHVGREHSLQVGENARTQVGRNKLVEVGEKLETRVGKHHVVDVGEVFEITAGEKFVVTVGETRFQMDRSGVVTIEAPLTTIVKGAEAQLTVGPGPILYVPALVPGATPSPPAQCLKRMAASSTPFVRM